jgi:N-hydroxyarylamine O-acetyltransferase
LRRADTVGAVADVDVDAYLARLGLSDPGPPSVAALFALHRAHLERVPYENLEIQLGRPTTVDPYESVARLLRGRGGYCYHLNGALSVLLKALGFQVRWHVGGVQGRGDAAPVGANANHLALTVHGLPAPQCPDGVWLVDAGLGEGPHEPLPLRPGTYRQGPFRYELDRSLVVPGGWRFTHDPAGSFTGMDFAWPPARPASFTAMHTHLSTSPESGFVRKPVVVRRHAAGADLVRGCVLTRLDGSGSAEEEIGRPARWFAVLADLFGLTLEDVDMDERAALWRRVRTAHEAWLVEQARS